MISPGALRGVMRRRFALLAALLCLPLAGAEVAGPDGDGAYLVSFLLERAAAGEATLELLVERDDGENTTRRTEPLGRATLPAGRSTWNASFLPEGDGAYLLRLLVDGAPVAEERLVVRDAAGGASRVTFEVPDEPTRLTLDRDDVNANGKTKSPGDAVLTRFHVADANGMADLDGLFVLVERAGIVVDEGPLQLPGAPNATNVSVEHRFARAPLPAGEHRLTVHALRDGISVASLARTFVVKDVAPTLEPYSIGALASDDDLTERVPVVLADRNGPGAGALEARVYRGSARAEPQGVLARFGGSSTMALADGAPLAPVNGSARTAYPMDLVVPRSAPLGSYRVSLYANGTLVGSLPFEVRDAPRLTSFAAAGTPEGLRVVATTSGPAILLVRLFEGETQVASSAIEVAHEADATIAAPRRGADYRWTAELRSRADGPVLDAREGTWRTGADAPPLRVTPGPARRAWDVASDWDLAGGEPTIEVARWDGAKVEGFQARLVRGRLLLEAPPTLASGRYDATLRIALPNGSVAEGAWSFEEGPVLRVALGAPVVEGREARIPVRNDGGVAVSRLVAQSSLPQATLTLETKGRVLDARGSGARSAFDVDLAPGEEAVLVLRLPPGPLRGGALAADVRVLAQAAR